MPAVDAGYSTSDRRAANPPANLPRGAKDKKHPMSHNLNGTITVIGIDIGNNSFQCGCLALREQRYSLSWARAA